MMKKIGLLFIVIILLLPSITAEEISFSVDQKEYYFLTGQEANIPLHVNNSYNKTINGVIQYTIKETSYKAGQTLTYSNSNSQSISLEKGNRIISLGFGTSDSPKQLDVTLKFSYKETDDMVVTLDDITIYFVSNQSQMNNQPNPQQSSSQKVTQGSQNQNNNNQQQQPQTPQQKLQNNQASQDSQALKEQIQKQLQEQQEMQEQFEENLFNNEEFKNQHQKLLDQGYNILNKDLQSKTNDSGDFNLTYKNKQGESASMQGSMENGEIQKMQTQTAEDRENMLSALNQSQQYQDYKEQLEQLGYNQTNVEFKQDGNRTDVQIQYENEQNETATIHAEFQDDELQQVTLEKEESIPIYYWIIPIILIATLPLILYYFYKKKHRLQPEQTSHIPPKPFDYYSEAKRLLKEAEALFQNERYKDAYGKAAQSIRLYLSYKNGLNVEITNDQVVKYLKRTKKPFTDIKKCFDLCSLVEFAKYQANDKDFTEIVMTAGSIISN